MFSSMNIYMFSSMNSSIHGTQECSYLQGFVWRKKNLPEHNCRSNSYALICFNYLGSLITVLLNSLVIFTIKPKRALQGNSNILWVCLVGSWMKPWFLQSLLNAKSGYVSRIKWILENSKHWKWIFMFFYGNVKKVLCPLWPTVNGAFMFLYRKVAIKCFCY